MTPLPPTASSRLARASAAALIVLLVLLVFGRALGGEYVYDDLLVIQQNPQITSFANLPTIFSSSYWDFLDAETAKQVGYYRPLTMVLLTAGKVLGGGEPEVFHALSLAIYALACLAAWRFAVRLLRSEVTGLAAAVLFALHPLHVEPVAWISALHEPLFCLFSFLSLNAFLRWRDEGSRGRPWASGVWFALALLSKDAAVAVLPLLVAIDWGRTHAGASEGDERLAAPKRAFAPVVLVFAAYYVLRVAVFGDLLAGFDRTTTHFGVSAGRLALLRIELLGGVVGLLAWPVNLNLFRPFKPELPAGDPSLIVGLVGTLVFVALVVLAWRRRWRPMLAMLLFIPAAVAPVLIRVGSLGTFPLSDRFLFLAALGFTALLAWVLFTFLPRPVAVGVALLVAVGYGIRDYTQLAYWKDEETLFRRAIEQNPRNPNVYWGLGRVKLTQYKTRGGFDRLEEARRNFELGMELLAEAQTTGTDIFATDDDHLQTNLGLAWAHLFEAEYDTFRDFQTPRTVFEKVVGEYPESERGYVGLGVTWLAEGDPNKAGEYLRRAIELNPRSPEAHFNMGLLFARIDQWEKAAEEFRACLSLRNENLEDLAYLGRALMEAGQDRESFTIATRTNELYPDAPDPMVILGMLAANEGNFTRAVNWFDQALLRGDRNGAAHLQRGKALIALGQSSSATKALVRSCELMPTNFEAHYNLMLMLMASDRPREAVPVFLRAYRLRPSGQLDPEQQEFNRRLREVAEAIPGDDVPTLVALATIDADRGDLALAEHWARKALAADPEHAPSHYILGVVLKTGKELENASPHLVAAAQALDDDFHAQMECAEVLLYTDREREATPYLHRALELLPAQKDLPEPQRKEAETSIMKALEKIATLDQAGPPAEGDGE